MKLILSSAGFTTEEIISKCEELVGKKRDKINIAVINEGYAVEHEDNLRWVLDDLNRVKDIFGGQLELVNLLALDLKTIEERIKLHDVIFVVGGNADYLKSVFDKTGFTKLLPELLKTKVYIGSSAGGMILGKRVSEEAYKLIYGEDSVYGVDHYFEFVDLAIMPHLDSIHFPLRKETLNHAAKGYSGVIYGIKDDSAVVFEDGKTSIIGSEPYIYNKP